MGIYHASSKTPHERLDEKNYYLPDYKDNMELTSSKSSGIIQSQSSTSETSSVDGEQSVESRAGTATTASKWTTRKVVILILLSFVYFLTWCSVSLWSPFLPIEASKRGVTSTEVGFIYGIYSLVSFLIAFYYGPVLIPQTGPYFVLFAGLFLNGGSSVICGFLDLIKDRQMFTIYCFIVRAVGALGGAACETSIFVVVTDEFRENIALAISLIRGFTAIGFIVGPVLGGGLYEVGGFRLPLVVTGGMLLTALPLVWLLLPRKETHQTERKKGMRNRSLRQAFGIPAVLVLCSSYFIGVTTISFTEPTLQPFAQKLGVSPAGVGLLFVCTCSTYILCTFAIGYILDRKSWKRTFMTIGAFGTAVTFMFVGPAPFLYNIGVPRTVWSLAVSLGFSGFNCALFLVPILPEMLECCYERGFPKDINTDSLVSGIYTGFCNLGAFAGPAAGGILTGSVGFPWTCTIFSFIVFGEAVALLVFFYCCRRKDPELDPECERLLMTQTLSYDTVNIFYRRSLAISN